MLNEAHYEQDWAAQGFAPARPHMETNRWLDAVRPTRSGKARAAQECETFDLLGVKLVWTKDGSRPFPAPVLNVIRSLIDFAGLPADWNSYGGRPLSSAAVSVVMQFVIKGHQTANVPRLFPLPDGGVGLAWADGENELDVAIAANGTLEGLASVDGNEDELTPGSSLDDGIQLFERYFAAR